MKFNKHYTLKDTHAILGASQNSWLNYDDDKLAGIFRSLDAKRRGTELHKFAEDAIRLGIVQIQNENPLNQFINDAIYHGLESEVLLYYSEYCFGTADAIGLEGNILRIHDYKSGKSKVTMTQLKIYAALFCLEYNYDPTGLIIELKIFQHAEPATEVAPAEEIQIIMNRIVYADRMLRANR